MPDQTRNYLKQRFDDGERPTGSDFADFLDSFLNKEDDKVRLAAGNNLSIPAGLTLANSGTGTEGTLRFTGTEVQVFATGSWKPIAGQSGAFTPVGAGPQVSYGAGNVGIGTFTVPSPPTHKLDITLPANTAVDTDRRVRIGHLAVHNGSTNDAAYLAHENMASSDQVFALRQDGVGNTTVNTPTGARLMLAQNNAPRFQVLTSGNISITPQASVSIDGTVVIGSVATPRSLTVHGTAARTLAGPFDAIASDIRVKKDVRPLDYGLREICGLNPVFYKFNGKAGLPADEKEHVGLIAQDIKEVLPFMIKKADIVSDNDADRDLLTYESGPLTFIMINAIRELSQRVEKLEAELAGIKKRKQ